MDRSQITQQEQAESLFADWLARVDHGEDASFANLLARNPTLAEPLAQLHGDYLAFAPLLQRVVPGVDMHSLNTLADAYEEVSPPSDAALGSELLESLGVRTPESERYRFRSVLGRGGAGVVLAVWDAQLRRDVAMKLALGHPSNSPARALSPAARRAQGRFVAEARIVSRLDHPGIVPVHELGADPDGRLYFTMKIVAGEDLAKVYERVRRRDGSWPTLRALGVLQRVCETMEYAHDRGVVHRDLKPSNVMVGSYGEVYVTDWGLARLRESLATDSVSHGGARSVREGATSPFASVHNSIAGTPCYMSPEQAGGDLESISPRWDVYALGAMLYELLVGAPPYASELERPTPESVLTALENGPPRRIGELAPGIAPELVAICERAMERDPTSRYASMAELGADLRAFLEGRVVRAHDASAWTQVRKWVRRNRSLATSIGAALVILLAGFTMTFLQMRRANAAEGDMRFALERESIARKDADRHALEAEQNAAEAKQKAIQTGEVVQLLQDVMIGVSPRAGGTPEERRAAVFREVVARLDAGALASAPEWEGTLWSSLASLAAAFDEPQRELEFAERSLAVLQTVYGKGDPVLADIRALCGAALAEIPGREIEAIERLQSAVETYELSPVENGDALARARSNIGFALNRMGQYERALEQHNQSLEMRRRLHADDHLDLANSLGGIGQTWMLLGRPEQAIEFGQQAIDMAKRLHSDDSPGYAQWMTNVGVALGDLERNREALEYIDEAYEVRRRIYEGDHEDIARSLSDRGHALTKLGRWEESRQVLEQAVAHAHRLYGDMPSPVTAECLNNLGGVLWTVGEYEPALERFEEALKQFRAVLPAPSSRVAMLESNVAMSLAQAGHFERAEAGFRRSIEINRQIHGGDHPEIATTLGNLGNCLQAAGRYGEALEAFREARASHERLRPPDHPDLSNAYSNEGGCLQEMGRFDEARVCHERALEARLNFFGEQHPLVARSLLYLANLSALLEGPRHALGLYERAAAILESSSPVDDLELAGSSRNLGACLWELGRCREALERMELALELRERHLDPRNRPVLGSLLDIAAVQYDLRDLETALSYALRAAERAESLPSGDRLRVRIDDGLAAILTALEARK